MDEITFDKHGNFIVQESSMLNYLIAFIFLVILFGILVTRNFERGDQPGSFFTIYLFFLVAALVFFVKAKRRGFIMMINRDGIYYKTKFITDWNNFINAYILQEEYKATSNSDGIADIFDIMVIFFDPASNKNYTCKLRMSSSQDKSEYQIISAIQYFSKKQLSFEIF